MSKKIIVIGCPGSGKSYFSKLLSEKTEIPLYHMDNIFWNEDRTTITREELIVSVDKIMATDTWIIDGNYRSTLDMRIKQCETVIFLDFIEKQCMEGIQERVGTKRSDMPWIENEISPELVELVKNFAEDTRPQIINLLEKYKEKEIIIFKSREETNQFLEDKYRG